MDQDITLEYCLFNPKKWYKISIMNFITAQTIFFLLLHLLPMDRSPKYLIIRTCISLGLYFGFLPYMFIYNMYGGYGIQNPDNRLARETKNQCFNSLTPKIFLTGVLMLVFIELLVFFLMGYAVYIRFKHFRRI